MKICPYCQTNNSDYDILCKSCSRIIDTSPKKIERKKERLKNRTNKNELKNKSNNDKSNLLFVLAIIVRIFALVDFFVIFRSNNITINVLLVIAVLFPFAGDIISNVIILLSPVNILSNNNAPAVQTIILIIVFLLYIPIAAIYSYQYIFSKFKSKRIITSILAVTMIAYITISSVVKFNTYTSLPDKSPVPDENISLNSISSYVLPGENAYISVFAEPKTKYSISVEYNSGYSTADGLDTKETDSNGFISWHWEVGTRTAAGTYPVTITNCNFPFNSETFYFTVK